MSYPSASPAAVAALLPLLAAPKRIVITTHFNPDGDAMGSSLGLAFVLEAMGHAVQVVLPNPAPGNLRWMPGHQTVVDHSTAKEASEKAFADAELLFCLDYNRADRVHDLESFVRQFPLKVLIDHHRDPEDIFNVVFSDIRASSTCQMVYDVIMASGKGELIDVNAAICLYSGIMTDSGSFRFPTTTPHTLRVAAELLEHGATPHLIHEAIMEDNTIDRLRLTGFALSERLQVLEGGEGTIIALSKADLERFNYVPGDTEGLVNYGLGVRGIRLSAFLAEQKNVVKISLRSKGKVPVNEFLAEHFEGGGHANAAGGRSLATLQETVDKLVKELPIFLAKHPV